MPTRFHASLPIRLTASLGVLLTLFLIYWAQSRPGRHFAWFHDDTLYFSSAKSLAEGHGYRMPSVPGTPLQTKYPVLYSWLLSLIWRWRPSFPDNLPPALWLSALLACVFLTASFLQLRCLKGLGDAPAFVVVGVTAFQTLFVFLSGAVMSDMTFMALTMTAAVLGDSAVRPGGRLGGAVAAGAVSGLAFLSRAQGIAAVAGILAIAVYRRAWRQGLWYGCVFAPFFLFGILWPGPPEPAPPGGGDGWYQTWLYYTSYWGFWKLSVPDWTVLRAMLTANVVTFFKYPSTMALFPPLGGDTYPGFIISITLSVGILAGLVRQARQQEWRPIHFIFVSYSAIVVLWNYAVMDRFLMMFLPFFYAGVWLEGKHLAAMLLDNFRRGPWANRMLAAVLSLAATAVFLYAGWHYLFADRSAILVPNERREALARQKAELFAWIRANTDPGARFIAYQDVNLYLHTGRQAMRPIAFSTAAFYARSEKVLERDLLHFTDVARRIEARYWVVASDDFDMETGVPLIEKRMEALKSVLPMVFQSQGDKVRLYDLACLHEGERVECRQAARVLVPLAPSP